MNIAFDHQIFSKQKFGGISRIYFNLADQLNKHRDVQVKIFSPVYINKYIQHLPPYFIEGHHINKYPFQIKPIVRYLTNQFCKRAISKWKPDIVHETYYSTTRTAPKFIPTILTVYDMIHELFPDYFFYWDQTKNHKKKAINRAQHIICISESTKKGLINLYSIPPEDISVIYLASDQMMSTMESNYSSEVVNTFRPFVLYVGQRNGYKNFNRFFTAFASDPGLYKQFDIVCFGGGNFTHKEQIEISKLGANKFIRQVNGNDDLLISLYRSATAFICPSVYEGFGLPILESMTFNCPVICSNISSLPEVAGDAAELFNPFDEEAILYSLKAVLFSKDRQKELIDKGQKRVSFFSWQKCAEQTLEVYERVASNR